MIGFKNKYRIGHLLFCIFEFEIILASVLFSISLLSGLIYLFIMTKDVKEGTIENVYYNQDGGFVSIKNTTSGNVYNYNIRNFDYFDEFYQLKSNKILYRESHGYARNSHEYYCDLYSLTDLNGTTLPYNHPYAYYFYTLFYVALCCLLISISLFIHYFSCQYKQSKCLRNKTSFVNNNLSMIKEFNNIVRGQIIHKGLCSNDLVDVIRIKKETSVSSYFYTFTFELINSEQKHGYVIKFDDFIVEKNGQIYSIKYGFKSFENDDHYKTVLNGCFLCYDKQYPIYLYFKDVLKITNEFVCLLEN